MQRATGDFVFNSLNDFLANNALSLTYQNAVTGTAGDAAPAVFGYEKDGFFLQDHWSVNDNLTIRGCAMERYSTGSSLH